MDHLRVFLADDHRVVRAGLRALIEAQPDMEVVGEAGDGLEVMAQVEQCRPNVTVMDISMPHLNGMHAAERLLARFPQMRILILSVHEETSYLRQAIEVGAAGYVLKRSAAEVLIEAIRVAMSGEIYLDPALSHLLLQSMIGTPTLVPGDATALSEREAEVLRQIARGYSNKEIASQLDLSVKTVETYKARAMEKLGMTSRVDIVRYAAEQGWLSQI